MMKRQKTVMATLECDKCGSKMSIQRKASKQKKQGHVKHMYCPGCKETTAFIEKKTETDANLSFWEEFQNGND